MGGTEGLRAFRWAFCPTWRPSAAAGGVLVTAVCILASPPWQVEWLPWAASEVVILRGGGGFMAHHDRDALLGINPLCWIKMP